MINLGVAYIQINQDGWTWIFRTVVCQFLGFRKRTSDSKFTHFLDGKTNPLFHGGKQLGASHDNNNPTYFSHRTRIGLRPEMTERANMPFFCVFPHLFLGKMVWKAMENTSFSGEVSSQLGQAATSSEEDCGWETKRQLKTGVSQQFWLWILRTSGRIGAEIDQNLRSFPCRIQKMKLSGRAETVCHCYCLEFHGIGVSKCFLASLAIIGKQLRPKISPKSSKIHVYFSAPAGASEVLRKQTNNMPWIIIIIYIYITIYIYQ